MSNSNKQPVVSVIMGVYNQWNREYLHEAVKSILCQNYTDFEFIIYDDGSDDEAASYIKELEKLDDRIVLIGKEVNHGLAFSLNACIHEAKGKYIARMDADDISAPNRLKTQVEFLDNHPEYAWCGTNARLFDQNGVWGERKMPEAPEYEDYLKYSPYIHPTVMYRTEIFNSVDGYKVCDETLRCEDYELFMRLRRMGHRGYNIQENLFSYREDIESFKRRRMSFRINEAKLRYRNFRAMGILFPKGWIYVLRPVIGGLVPAGIIAKIKRKESSNEEKYKDTNTVSLNDVNPFRMPQAGGVTNR